AIDGISAVKTAISVSTSSISGGAHGISVDLSGGIPGTPVRLSGNRFTSTSADAILGQALAGQPVWITDNRIQGAGTYGIRLLSADQLVLRNNNIAASGGGPGAGAGRYPAIYLPALSADFAGNIRGNVGGGNGLDAVVFDGKANRDLAWITPSNATSTHPLGYLLDGALIIASNAAGDRGTGDIRYALINYASSGISLDSGPNRATSEPNFRLTVANTTVANASKDGISSFDTPFSVDGGAVQNVGANGI